MKLRNIISIILSLIIIGMIYFLYSEIMSPVKFKDEYNKRSTEVINKLKDIRTIQEAYKTSNGRFCSDIDSLLIFLETGKVNMVRKYGIIPDSLTQEQAIKIGIIKSDTVQVNLLQKLIEEKKLITKEKEIKNLKYIPYSDNKVFEMKAGFVKRGGIMVPVFEACADIMTYTKGLKKQDIINKKAETEERFGYSGWKVGDITQPVIEGNWE